MQREISRRQFLQATAAAGAGLVIGFYLPGCTRGTPVEIGAPAVPEQPPDETGAGLVPNAYLRIDPGGQVTVVIPKSEMGQGVNTTLAMLVAEELEADWTAIRVEHAPAGGAYGNQVTGGSTSISQCYGSLRRAGADARATLIAAAAGQWGVAPEECAAEHGAVVHAASGRKLTYGELADAAAQVPPQRGQLKDPEDFRVIGQRLGMVDNPGIVTGQAVYGSDLRLPGMLHAVVARCPVWGGKAAGFDDSRARAVPGVRHVVEIERGVAVVADTTWAALEGRRALDVTWDRGPNAGLSSDDIRREMLAQAGAAAAGGEVPPGAVQTLAAVYENPYLAHATMEPMTCVADVRAGSCRVWAPTQDRMQALRLAASRSGVPAGATEVITPLIGGGFGRRLSVEYVGEAVEIATAVGAPVKLFWTREDDIQHDLFRPASYHVLKAGLDAAGGPVFWRHWIATQGIAPQGGTGGTSDVTAGGGSLPYRFPASARAVLVPAAVRTTYWRAVYNSNNAFVNECFMDELAGAAGQDPYRFRREWASSDDMREVLDLAAGKAGWGSPLPAGRGRGIACHATWGVTPVAQVAEVSVESDGTVRVHRVVCAVSCGMAVNPDVIEAQMEGGIIMGLSAALREEITLQDGRVQQSNFHDYPILRLRDTPTIEVYIVPSDAPPRGIGEMANPPAVAAVANAVFAATGRRIRRLPIRPADLQ